MKKIEQLIERYLRELKDENTEIRTTAANRLKELSGSEGVNYLINKLTIEQTRKVVIKALKEINDNRVIKPLLDLFIREQSIKVKALIAWALGHYIYDDFNMDVLVKSLDEDNTFLLRNIIFALGNNRSKIATSKLHAILKEDDRIEIRKMAVWALGMIGSRESLEYLIEALSDPSYKVRESIGRTLTHFPHTKLGANTILEILNNENHPGRRSAIYILGRLQWTNAVPKLIEVLKNVEDYHIRKQTIRALALIRDARALEEITKGISDTNKEIRVQSISALSYFYMDFTIEMISKIIERLDDKDNQVRLKAIHFINQIYGSGYIPIEIEKARPRLLEMLANDSSEEIRTSITRLFIATKDEREIEALRIQALNDESALVRVYAANALVTWIDEPIIQELLKALDNPYWRIRSIAHGALYHTKELQKYSNVLFAIFKDKENLGRFYALDLLGNRMTKETVGELLEVLMNEEDPETRKRIIKNFWRVKDERIEKTLQKLMETETDEGVRSEAHKIVEMITTGDPFYFIYDRKEKEKTVHEKETDLERIIETIEEDINYPNRMHAVIALGNFTQDKRIVKPLVSALRDINPRVRMAAAYTLRFVESTDILDPLITTLSDEHRKVRLIATRTIMKLEGTKSKAKILIKLLKNPQHIGRLNVVSILGNLKMPSVVPAIIDVIKNDPSDEIRRTAIFSFQGFFDERAAETIKEALQSAVPIVKKAATSIFSYGQYKEYLEKEGIQLVQLGFGSIMQGANQQTINQLMKDLYHPVWNKRRAAFVYLKSLERMTNEEHLKNYNLVKKVEKKFN